MTTSTTPRVETTLTDEKQAPVVDSDVEKVDATPEAKPIDKDTRITKLEEALKEANREAASRRKKLEAYEAEEAKRKEAEMTELQKAEKRAAEAEARIVELEIRSLRRTVADEVGLPPILADRLQGKTADEMKADAETLLKSLPEPTKSNPKINPTNPEGGEKPVTDAERRKFLFG